MIEDPSEAGATSPKVCVALATYNGEKYLADLLHSLCRQTWSPLEVVVADDGSSDSTVSSLQSFKSTQPLRIVAHADRVGVVSNFNRALSACDGDYVALADQDDVWLPQKISLLMEQMQQQEDQVGKDTPLLVFCNLKVVDERLNGIPPFVFMQSVPETQERQTLIDLLLRNSIPGCAMLVNRALLRRALPIPTGFFMHDWWLALSAVAFGRIRGVDNALVLYRQHQDNSCGAVQPGMPSAADWLQFQTWLRLIQASRLRNRVILANLAEFEARYAGILPESARHEVARFRRRFTNPLLRAQYALRTHSGFSLWLLQHKWMRWFDGVKATQGADRIPAQAKSR